MFIALVISLAAHVLAAVFWAGSSFAMARSGNLVSPQTVRPQLGAAILAVLTGGLLWGWLHRASFGHSEAVLAFGIGCALVGLALQAITGIHILRSHRNKAVSGSAAHRMAGRAQRVAAGLLAITVICMATSRYV